MQPAKKIIAWECTLFKSLLCSLYLWLKGQNLLAGNKTCYLVDV